MATNTYNTLLEGLRYRGEEGQWSWLLHRATGVGVFLFLALHIFDIYLISFGPDLFNKLAAIYHHPVSRVGHIFLFFSLIWHAFNGTRITLQDFMPRLWKYQRQAVMLQVALFLVIFIPTTLAIIASIISHL